MRTVQPQGRRNLDAIFEPSEPTTGSPHSFLAHSGAPVKRQVKRIDADDPIRVRAVESALERWKLRRGGSDAL